MIGVDAEWSIAAPHELIFWALHFAHLLRRPSLQVGEAPRSRAAFNPDHGSGARLTRYCRARLLHQSIFFLQPLRQDGRGIATVLFAFGREFSAHLIEISYIFQTLIVDNLDESVWHRDGRDLLDPFQAIFECHRVLGEGQGLRLLADRQQRLRL